MKNNGTIKLANLRMLQFVAEKLQDLCDELVFLGGCTTALFITDPEFPDVRYTLDVDCIVDVISLTGYYQLENKLSKKGFKKSISENVICRWFYDDVILDVMPTDENILGFGNRWYKKAIEYSKSHSLTDELNIKIVSAPYYIATKLEAFKTRGKMDFYASHDFEDIISVIDGRLEVIKEIHQSDEKLKNYLIENFREIDNNLSFHGAIAGHFVQYGRLAEARTDLLEQKIKEIIKE